MEEKRKKGRPAKEVKEVKQKGRIGRPPGLNTGYIGIMAHISSDEKKLYDECRQVMLKDYPILKDNELTRAKMLMILIKSYMSHT